LFAVFEPPRASTQAGAVLLFRPRQQSHGMLFYLQTEENNLICNQSVTE